MADERHLVLKVGERSARLREAAALSTYEHGAGPGRPPACRVLRLAADVGEGSAALLLERVLLGDDLRPLARTDDDAATQVMTEIVRDLHRAARATGPSGGPAGPGDGPLPRLPHLATLLGTFDDYAAAGEQPLPRSLVLQARGLATELTAASTGDIVLHGDLHHANVLRSGIGDGADRWRAIDPHGWVGDPAFDTAAFLLNPQDVVERHGDPAGLALRRASILAEGTGIEADRILAWALVGGVVSELWCWADHGFVAGGALRLAEALAGR
ncbi:MAG: hypothetical protein RLZ55_1097 [Actinomycetota bacterium]|jgi:streptomycin 6-kinase